MLKSRNAIVVAVRRLIYNILRIIIVISMKKKFSQYNGRKCEPHTVYWCIIGLKQKPVDKHLESVNHFRRAKAVTYFACILALKIAK